MGNASTDNDLADTPQTCCSTCRTIFEVSPELLSSSDTRVRCGECLSIFDALANLRDPEPDAEDTVETSAGSDADGLPGASRSGAGDVAQREPVASGRAPTEARHDGPVDHDTAEEAHAAGLAGGEALDVTYSDFDLFSGDARLPEVAYLDETSDAPDFDFDTVDLDEDETFDDTLFVRDETIEPVAFSDAGNVDDDDVTEAFDPDEIDHDDTHAVEHAIPGSARASPPSAAAPVRASAPSVTPPAAAARVGTRRGVPAGVRAGARAGVQTGAQASTRAGVQAGTRAGVQPGARAGTQPGTRAGVQTGARVGTRAPAPAFRSLAPVPAMPAIEPDASLGGAGSTEPLVFRYPGDDAPGTRPRAASARPATAPASRVAPAPRPPATTTAALPVSPAYETPPAARAPWLLRSVLLLVFGGLLVGLYALRERDSLHDNPLTRPVLLTVCGMIGCEVPSRVDLASLTLLDKKVFTHPTQPNALVINVAFRNTADFDQRFPVLVVRLRDRRGGTVAERDFAPSDYRDGWAPGDTIAAHRRLDISLEVDDPGDGAESYEFEFREGAD